MGANGNYIGTNFSANWTTANSFCTTQYGTTLATITSDAEQNTAYDAFFTAIPSTPDTWSDRFFIGLNDIDDDDIWTWIDGSNSTYRSIFELSGDGNCAEYITSEDVWNDLSCSSTRYFVCNDPNATTDTDTDIDTDTSTGMC